MLGICSTLFELAWDLNGGNLEGLFHTCSMRGVFNV